MGKSAAVITISDKGSRGEREDKSGPVLVQFLKDRGFDVQYTNIIPDDAAQIRTELVECVDGRNIALVLTTGGTGLTKRDVTPEAALGVMDRVVPGIPEAMRAKSMEITPMGCLSRAVAGIRKESMIITLPGSPKAAIENIEVVIKAVEHGLELICLEGSADQVEKEARKHDHDHHAEKEKQMVIKGVVKAVCMSNEKGTAKRPVEEGVFIEDWGIKSDAHAGKWHRQVSLLDYDKVVEFNQRGAQVVDGDFGENLLVSGIDFKNLPVGTIIKCNDVVLRMTQIGKECHHGCAIRNRVGDCIMPREGVFAEVLHEGTIKPGDEMTAEPAAE